jgi:hypothetical protein
MVCPCLSLEGLKPLSYKAQKETHFSCFKNITRQMVSTDELSPDQFILLKNSYLLSRYADISWTSVSSTLVNKPWLCFDAALNDALREEVQRLKIAAGQVPNMNGNPFNGGLSQQQQMPSYFSQPQQMQYFSGHQGQHHHPKHDPQNSSNGGGQPLSDSMDFMWGLRGDSSGVLPEITYQLQLK